MWEGQPGTRRGNQGYEQMATCAFSLLLCFTVIDGHGLPPIMNDDDVKDYSFFRDQCARRCAGACATQNSFGSMLWKTILVCLGKRQRSLDMYLKNPGPGFRHDVATLLTVFLGVLGYGSQFQAADHQLLQATPLPSHQPQRKEAEWQCQF